MRLLRWSLLCAVAPLAFLSAGCQKEGCLGNTKGCDVASPCSRLEYACSDSSQLSVKKLTRADDKYRGMHALAAAGDFELTNGKVTAVIAGIGNPNHLDKNGGSLIDLYNPSANNDAINGITSVVGILPRNFFIAEDIEIIDRSPEFVAVQVKGALDELRAAQMYIRYELRPCDPGVRVRTELVNGTHDPYTWTLMDAYLWAKRGPAAFTSNGNGFVHPAWSLLTIQDAFRTFPILAWSSHGPEAASYSQIACNVEQLAGVHASDLSSAGLPPTVVPPRGYLVYERFLMVTDKLSVAPAIDLALEAREKLFGEKAITLTGKVERAGALKLDSERETSILISSGRLSDDAAQRLAWTQTAVDANGNFAVRVPSGKPYVLEAWSFGQKVAEREIDSVDGDTDVGTFTLPSTARVTLNVLDGQNGQGVDSEIFIVRPDLAAADSFHGAYEKCGPWLGEPPGESPACNRVLLRNGQARIELHPGTYHFYAFRGPFWTLARRTETLSPTDVSLSFTIEKLPIQPAGTITGDLHIHGGASFDSQLPDYDRVLSFSAVDLQVAVSTDHDVIHDYSPTVTQLGLQNSLTTVVGAETTPFLLWLKAPGATIPNVIGHYNFWPLKYRPWLPRNGLPPEEEVEPGQLMDRMEAIYSSAVPLVELNHPWAEPEAGRELGFPRMLWLDTNKNLPASDDGSAAGIYVRVPGKNRNNGHHAQEVMNGTDNDALPAYRAFWFYVLNQGQFATGTANSDSHSLFDNTVGVPRNVIWANTQSGPSFNVDRFNEGIRNGQVVGTNGPMIEATIDDASGPRRFSLKPFKPAANASVKVKVTAAPWVPVTEVRFIVNGKQVKTASGAELSQPTDPFGKTGVVRYDKEVPLSELGISSTDSWLVIEAGSPLPLFADLGGLRAPNGEKHGFKEGIPDTSDNNQDGVVDEADIAEGSRVGPLRSPPAPTDETHPQYHFSVVVTRGYPFGYTNPFVLDMNGNGTFEAPGAGVQQ